LSTDFFYRSYQIEVLRQAKQTICHISLSKQQTSSKFGLRLANERLMLRNMTRCCCSLNSVLPTHRAADVLADTCVAHAWCSRLLVATWGYDKNTKGMIPLQYSTVQLHITTASCYSCLHKLQCCMYTHTCTYTTTATLRSCCFCSQHIPAATATATATCT
jgi:hypothetical protein